MRNDTGTTHSRVRGRWESWVTWFPSTLLVDTATHHSRDFFGNVWPSTEPIRHGSSELDWISVVTADCTVGRLAIFFPWLAIGCESQPKHVDPDRSRYRGCFYLQCGCDHCTTNLSRLIYLHGSCRCLLWSFSGHHFIDPTGTNIGVKSTFANFCCN